MWPPAHRPPPSGTYADRHHRPETAALIRILSTRSLLAICAGLALASCSGQRSPIDLHTRVEIPEQRPIEVRIALQPEHARDAHRYVEAAVATLKTCVALAGPLDVQEIALTDRSWNERDAVDPGTPIDRVPWWTIVASMAPELAVARAVSRRCWNVAVDARDQATWFVDGLAEFTARRAVVPIFERGSNPPGFAILEQRYFGGFVPRFTWIRLLAETDGEPASAFRAHRGVDVQERTISTLDERALAGKTVVALGTLERWVGRPVFDGIVLQFVRDFKGKAPQLADFERVATDVSGQRLSWFFDEVFRSSGVFDYGVEAFASETAADGGIITTVTARRYGHGRFTGASGNRIGAFDNGRGITLRVAFADGRQRTDWWDGRDERRTFRYHSQTRAVSAVVDPDRVLLLDLNQTNNSWTLAPRHGAAATRWATIYLQWLEHFLLSYASLF
jgi:hypothetical protein